MKRILLSLLLVTALGIFMTGVAWSAPQLFSLPWWTVDNGGGGSQAGNYQLHGTIGQADVASLSSGSYTLSGGFWDQASVSSEAEGHRQYLPLLLR